MLADIRISSCFTRNGRAISCKISPASRAAPSVLARSGWMLDDDELVAAQASDRVRAAHTTLQADRHLFQEQIADAVSERIVDRLEVVQIDEQQRNQAAVPPCLEQGAGQAIVKQAPVWQSRQRIVIGQERQVVLRFLALPG